MIKTLLSFLLGIFLVSAAMADELDFLRQQDWKNHLLLDSTSENSPAYQQLIKNMQNPRLVMLMFLLPPHSKTYDSLYDPKVQALIDNLYTEILKSPTAQWMCEKANGDIDLINGIFGVSSTFAKKMQKTCRAKEKVPLIQKTFRHRQYIFVVTPETPVVEAWTNNQNVTQFFIRSDEISRQYLLKLLIHEFAVAMDQKSSFGEMRTFAFGLQSAEYTGDNQCKVFNALRKPLAKYAFSSLRAEEIEFRILSELGYKVESTTKESECGDQALLRMIKLAQVNYAFGPEEDFGKLLNACPESLDPLEALEILRHEKMVYVDKTGKKEVSFCEFLKTPDLGLFSFSATVGGPRPRIGSGWGKEKQRSILTSEDGSESRKKFKDDFKEILDDPAVYPGMENGHRSRRIEKLFDRTLNYEKKQESVGEPKEK